MPKHPKLTASEAYAIVAHMDRMVIAARQGRDSCRAIPKRERTPYIEGQLAYWLNCVSAFKWASSVARQSAEVNGHAE